MNKAMIKEIGRAADEVPNCSESALVLIRELCKALLEKEQDIAPGEYFYE